MPQKVKVRNIYWFTLVELIVTITILVILGTIAFVSLSGFAWSARDSSRVSDLALIAKGLDLYYIKQGSFPMPSGAVSVTYSGAALWQQGNVGEAVITALWAAGAKLSTKPTDPLLRTEYGYSLSTGTPEYSLRTDYEGDSVARRTTPWADRANAATGNPTLAYIRGTYNGVATKTSTGGKVHILAIPSIFTVSGTTTVSETSAASFIVHGESLSGVAFTPKVVFSSGSLPGSDDERIVFASGVVAAYSGSHLAVKNGEIRSFVEALSSTGKLADHGGNFVRTRFGGSGGVASTGGASGTPPNSCATNPSFANLGTLTIWSPTSASQEWTYAATPTGNCTYSCTGGYSGSGCAIAPNSCAANPSFANLGTLTVWTPTSVNQAWAYSATPGNCTYACTGGYSGSNCLILPLSTQTLVLASDKAANHSFGISTAMSADSTTVVVGAYADPAGTTGAGAAYVFIRSGTTWTQQTKLTASDKAVSDLFGSSAAISSDGNTAVVGAYNADPGGTSNAGAAYIFVRSGTTWTQQAKLTASDKATDNRFGYSVAVSADGDTTVVGAYNAAPGGTSNAGAAYIFVRSGTTWTQQAKLTASDKAANDYFGLSVAISSDGDTALIGAFYADPGGITDAGATYAFVRSGTTWTQQAKLIASDKVADDRFGSSVAVSTDGNTAVVGANNADPGGTSNAGAAYIFVRSGTTWTQQAKLTATDKIADDRFGYWVAVSADGNTAVVGAHFADPGGVFNAGAAYTFSRSGASWTQQTKLTAANKAVADNFGASVSLSADGSTAVVGANNADPGGASNAGAAYIFQ